MYHMSWEVHVILVQQIQISRVYGCVLEDLAIWERVSHYLFRVVGYLCRLDLVEGKDRPNELGKLEYNKNVVYIYRLLLILTREI